MVLGEVPFPKEKVVRLLIRNRDVEMTTAVDTSSKEPWMLCLCGESAVRDEPAHQPE